MTIDVIAECAFGIEVNSLQPNGIDKSNKLYKAAIDTFAAFRLEDRWSSYFMNLAFYMFPDLMPISMSFPTSTMDCKYISITETYTSILNNILLENLQLDYHFL